MLSTVYIYPHYYNRAKDNQLSKNSIQNKNKVMQKMLCNLYIYKDFRYKWGKFDRNRHMYFFEGLNYQDINWDIY